MRGWLVSSSDCHDLSGYELFQYLDAGGQHQVVGSADVNQYLDEIGGEAFTAKDFRTWAGTVLTRVASESRMTTSRVTFENPSVWPVFPGYEKD